MLLFCPLCGGLLLVSNSSTSRADSSAFKCRTCAYTFPVEEGVAYASRVELKRKTVDDVLGGEDAWKNVDSTDGKLRDSLKTFFI
jgi:DNA-directed RNA polymerase III subunit RPC11